jgi:hypothetical protein
VAPIPRQGWEIVLLTLIPLAHSVERNIASGEQPLFIFRKGVPENAIKNLKVLSSSEPVKLDDIMCFDTLLMTATYSKLNNRENKIKFALESDIEPLRKRIKSAAVDEKKIAISENLWDALEFRIKERFTECQLVRIPAGDAVADIAVEVASARLLIGDHIASLIHMVWMTGGTVIDLSPDEIACNDWAQKFAQKVGLEYRKIETKRQCSCNDWKCYPPKPTAPGILEYDEIIAEMEKVLAAPAQEKDTVENKGE